MSCIAIALSCEVTLSDAILVLVIFLSIITACFENDPLWIESS